MRSKNSIPIDASEAAHLSLVRGLPCGFCGATQGIEAHHIVQGAHWLTIPACWEDHRGPLGIHGDQSRLRMFKLTELIVLNQTMHLLYGKKPPRELIGSNLSSSKIIPHKG